MKDISAIRTRFEKMLSKKHYNKNSIDELPVDVRQNVRMAAEVKAYQSAVIPDPYASMSIDDFSGKSEGATLLDTAVAINARKQIIDYCWRGTKPEIFELMDLSQRQDASSMTYRRDKGHNVIIFADSPEHGLKKQTGKTLCASLIMQEAITQRFSSGRICDTYEWIDFSVLFKELQETGAPSIARIQTCDWLVIDDMDLPSSDSDKMKSYISGFFDPFLIERTQQDKLPTIFVMRFHPSKFLGAEPTRYGRVMQKIASDKNTTIISLQ